MNKLPFFLSIAAIGSLKQQVEGVQDLNQSVEILIRLLCTVPGWNEKNVQVFEVFSNVYGRITRHDYVQGM